MKGSCDDTDLSHARQMVIDAICETQTAKREDRHFPDYATLNEIALTVDLILESFWYFKLEEIKYCFRRAMMREKLFDRLDGNIIIGWLREYDAERTEEAMSLSDAQAAHEDRVSSGAMSWAEYHDRLTSAAANGDAEAMAKIAEINDVRSDNKMKVLTKEQKHEKEVGFTQYFYNK